MEGIDTGMTPGGESVPCPACRRGMPAPYRYCGFCGAPLRAGTPAPEAPSSEQFRRLVVAFADLSGSTAMVHRFEAETAYRIVGDYLAGLCRIITAWDGYVVKTLGDGVMALFGAPVARGDDALRAAAAALAMQEWIEEYSRVVQERHGLSLRCRIGLNYGSVVAAPLVTGDRGTYDVIGDTVNVAQRIEAACEPGSVCTGEGFYRLTRHAYEYLELGAARVKGKPEPLPLYRLLGPRAEAAAPRQELPFAGRRRELAALREAARALRRKQGAVFALVGEGGIGKTRMLEELAGELGDLEIRVLRGSGQTGDRAAPLGLWRGWLLEYLPIGVGMPFAEAVERLRDAFPEGAAVWAQWVAALALEPQRLAALEAEAREQVTRSALALFLGYWRGDHPGAVLVDDAADADALSLRLLVEAAAGGPGREPLLVVLAGAGRDGFPPREATALPLGPLEPEEGRKLLSAALPGVDPGPGGWDSLLARSGGSPLFLDLMLREARAAEDPASTLAAVPDTVYGLVRARLDTLPAGERRAAESAAVLGHTFAERWLRALVGDAREGGERPWDGLERRQVLVEQRPEPERELQFRLGALQEVLYEGLLSAQRRREHAAAGRTIAAEAEPRPELAGLAALHLRRAEEWIPALHWTLAAADYAASVWAGEEARLLFEEALRIAGLLRRPSGEARGLAGLAEIASHQGDFPRALDLFERAGACAAALGESLLEEHPSLRLLAAAVQTGRARCLARTGEPAAAAPLLEEALALLGRSEAPEARRRRAQCLTEQAHTLAELGALEQAAAAGREALAIAGEEGWTAERAAAGAALGLIYPLMGDWPAGERELRGAAAAAEAAGDWQGAAACGINLAAGFQSSGRFEEASEALQQALLYAERIADREKIAIIHLNRGTVRLNLGDWAGAAAGCRSALEQFREMGHALGLAAARYNLADALRWAGNLDEADRVLTDAEAAMGGLDAPFLEVHVRVARAELCLARGEGASAWEQVEGARALAEECGYDTGMNLARLTGGRVRLAAGAAAEAAPLLRAALEGFTRSGEALEAARAQGELATALAAAGDAAAPALREEAVAAIRALGAAPWLEHLPGPKAAFLRRSPLPKPGIKGGKSPGTRRRAPA